MVRDFGFWFEFNMWVRRWEAIADLTSAEGNVGPVRERGDGHGEVAFIPSAR